MGLISLCEIHALVTSYSTFAASELRECVGRRVDLDAPPELSVFLQPAAYDGTSVVSHARSCFSTVLLFCHTKSLRELSDGTSRSLSSSEGAVKEFFDELLGCQCA